MKAIKIKDELIKTYMPFQAEKIISIMADRDSSSSLSAFRTLLHKQIKAFFISETSELESQIFNVVDKATYDVSDYSAYSIPVVKSNDEKLSVLKSYFGIMMQGEVSDLGVIAYRDDRLVITYNDENTVACAFNRRIVSSSYIYATINSIFGVRPNELSDDDAVVLFERTKRSRQGIYAADIFSGFKNTLINEIFIESFNDKFISYLFVLLTIDKIKYKPISFLSGDYAGYSYPAFSGMTIAYHKETIEELISLGYIDSLLNILEKGRILRSMMYLNYPAFTLGLSSSINFRNPFVTPFLSRNESEMFSLENKMYFSIAAFKDAIDIDYVMNLPIKSFELEKAITPSMTKVYPIAERLNIVESENKNLKFVLPMFAGGKQEQLANTTLTVLSSFADEKMYVVNGIFVNTIMRKYHTPDYYIEGNNVYVFDSNKSLIGVSPCIEESYNEFNLMTQMKYGEYGKTGLDCFRFRMADLISEKPVLVEQPASEDVVKKLEENFSINLLTEIVQEQKYAIDELGLLKRINQDVLKKYADKYASEKQGAEDFMKTFMASNKLSEDEVRLIESQIKYLGNISELLTLAIN